VTVLEVVCVKVRNLYDGAYVRKLRNMVAKHLTVPHRFICYTDKPVEGVECREIEDQWKQYPGYWAKTKLFKVGVPKPFLYIDLDSVLLQNIDDLIPKNKVLTTCRTVKLSSIGTKHKEANRGYRGPWWYAKCQSHVIYVPEGEYKQPTDVDVSYWVGDQDWLGWEYPDIAFYPDEWWTRVERLGSKDPYTYKIISCNSRGRDNTNLEWVRKEWM